VRFCERKILLQTKKSPRIALSSFFGNVWWIHPQRAHDPHVSFVHSSGCVSSKIRKHVAGFQRGGHSSGVRKFTHRINALFHRPRRSVSQHPSPLGSCASVLKKNSRMLHPRARFFPSHGPQWWFPRGSRWLGVFERIPSLRPRPSLHPVCSQRQPRDPLVPALEIPPSNFVK